MNLKPIFQAAGRLVLRKCRKIVRHRMFYLIVLVSTLPACSLNGFTLYLFGPAKSCYSDKSTTSPLKCDTLRVTDKVNVQMLTEKQEVVFVREGLRLNERNTVFRRLENCKIIDKINFECSGLARKNGRITDSTAMGTAVISESYWTFAFSAYLNAGISRDIVTFFDNNDSWINVVVVIIAISMFGGLFS